MIVFVVFAGCLTHGTAALFGEVYATGEAQWQPCALATGSAKILACGLCYSESNRVQHEQFLLGPTSRLRRLATVVEVFVAGVLGATAAARSRTAFKYRGFIGGDRKISSFI